MHGTDEPKSAPTPQPGEPFNPWRGACGFYPPGVVGRQRSIGGRRIKAGIKLLYERLCRRAGRDGFCFPCQKSLAADLGKSERQIRRDIEALEDFGLIRRRVEGRGRGKSTRTVFQFLWHQVFTDVYERTCMTLTSGHVRPLRADVHDTYERTSSLASDTNCKGYSSTPPAELGTLNIVQRIQSVRAGVTVQLVQPSTPLPPSDGIKEKPPSPLDSEKAGSWPFELDPIRRALQEHAKAIGREADLERDVALGRKLAAAAGGNGFAAASVIAKVSLRKFSERAVRRRPWPNSFGFWVGVIREELTQGAPEGPTGISDTARPERIAPRASYAQGQPSQERSRDLLREFGIDLDAFRMPVNRRPSLGELERAVYG